MIRLVVILCLGAARCEHRILWWSRWRLRDPGDALDDRWVKSMGLPPREIWQ